MIDITSATLSIRRCGSCFIDDCFTVSFITVALDLFSPKPINAEVVLLLIFPCACFVHLFFPPPTLKPLSFQNNGVFFYIKSHIKGYKS